MSIAVYLALEGRFLAERWLRAHPMATVRLVYADDSAAAAHEVQAHFPNVCAVVPLEAMAEEADENIVLPLSRVQRPLRYQAPTLLPDVRPHAALIARLWRAGYRRFTWYDLGGAQTLDLPWQLEELRDRHRGQRCFVVGNGPSLNQIDMTRLKDEITFGSNRGYLGFPEWGFEFNYWGIYDALQIEEYGPEYEHGVPEGPLKFYPLRYWPLLQLANACPVAMDFPRGASREFSVDPARMSVGYSVTYMLLQIAAFMGCDPIYLVGLDHRYPSVRTPRLARAVRLAGKWVAQRHDHTAWYRAAQGAAEAWQIARSSGAVSEARIWRADDAAGPTHFTNKYTGAQKRFLVPRPQDAERDYVCARAWAEQHGRQILNATPDSALKVFEHVDYNGLF